MFAHLTRVASLSPHLLRDMGFHDATERATPNVQILRKGAVTVSIQSRPNGADPIISIAEDTDETIDKP